jgi:hypothetical protein
MKKITNLPKELAELPVYDWDDDHGDNERIEVGPDGSVWHCVGWDAEKIEGALECDG